MNLKLLPNRVISAIILEVKALKTERCGLSYIIDKWKAVLFNKRHMVFLDDTFYYEDRLNPFTIFEYVNEVREMSKLFNFTEGRVLEIGANVGIWGYTLLNLYPDCVLYSFEPNPNPYHCLKKNSRKFKNWKIFNSGVSSQDEEVDLFFVPEKTGQGSVYKQNATANLLDGGVPSSVKVKLRALNKQFLESECGGSHFAVVKIDVEGYEQAVLDGLKAVTWDHMYVELSAKGEMDVDLHNFITMMRKTWPLAQIVKAVPKELYIDVHLSCVSPSKENCATS